MSSLIMQSSADCRANYPADSLRDWAVQALGAKRCSPDYLAALAVVFGNMARADIHRVTLLLKTVVPYASRQTMRNLLEQLAAVGLIQRWTNPKLAVYAYRGSHGSKSGGTACDQYNRIQRQAEEADFQRYCGSLGIQPSECPY